MSTRKVVVAALAGALLALLVAGPALAQQRDPFEPLVEESQSTAPASPEAAADEPAEPVLERAPTGSESLPTTGGDVSPLLGAAYVLIVIGGASLALAKIAASARS